MGQLFSKGSNSLFRTALLFGIGGIFVFGGVVYAIYRSPYTTRQDMPREQVVPFSHQRTPLSAWASIAATATPPWRNPRLPDCRLRKLV